MDQKDPVFRLEQALRLWEDRCFLHKMQALYRQAVGKPCPFLPEGPLKHAPEFRKFLIEASNAPPESALDANRFLLPLSMAKPLGKLWGLPSQITSWTLDSRRIFRLSLDLQAMLNATSLDGVLWRDVEPPFGTFVLALPSPIKDDSGREYDAMLFFHGAYENSSSSPELDALMREKGLDLSQPGSMAGFTLLPKILGELTPLSSFERDHILAGWRKKDWKKMLHWLNQAVLRLQPVAISTFGFMDHRVPDVPVTESLRNLHAFTHATTCTCGRQHVEWDAAARLFVGVSIHLASLPPGPSSGCTGWEKPCFKVRAPMSIMTEADVCTVMSSHVLSSEERETFLRDGRAGHGGYEVSSHFRRGHYRRRPGKGNDPTALKVVRIPPTLVRRDRLKDGVLPLASKTIIR